MRDRIRLAEAMGWTDIRHHPNDTFSAMPPGADPQWQNHLPIPDPFTDANDDYAVLEWMRSLTNTSEVVGRSMWNSFCDAMAEDEVNHVSCRKWNYTVGDYARAALKVIK